MAMADKSAVERLLPPDSSVKAGLITIFISVYM
jgi:hypothetical protein